MPNKLIENSRVNEIDPSKDKRRKLSVSDKIDIKEAFESGQAKRSLAREWGVSRRTIDFICHPERLRANLQAREERGGWRVYYDHVKHAQHQKAHRQYKARLLLLKGKD